ncbi:MAG TPA: protein kinase, partial [Polyangiaceae bacterium]
MGALNRGTKVDRYEIVDFLGSGGMGEVYRASDPKLARMIALKVIRADRRADETATMRLLREARAVAAMTHPNILAIYDVGEARLPESQGPVSFIAMELIVGSSLRNYIGDSTTPLPLKYEWLLDIAKAL